ncbi:MAG: hypothetical protein FWD05_01645 [Oscillospiraceae bacterium]|nr:hypothetical protein [Oscillospiraceae bacterium]
MKDTVVKKRTWAIYAGIIFVIVLALLTILSTQIMNRSLPEVATVFTSSGTITARIRGSGQVQANESFEVEISQTRTVAEVPVRLYDEIDIGDVLITLVGDGSEELEAAKAELHSLEVGLEVKLLELTRPDGNLSMANSEIQRARSNVTEAQIARDRISYSVAALNAAQTANTQAQTALSSADSTARDKQLELDLAEIYLNSLNPPPPLGSGDPYVYAQAEAARNEALVAVTLARSTLESATAAAAAAQTELSTQQGNRDSWNAANDSVRQAQQALDDLIRGLSLTQAGAGVDTALNNIELRELKQEIEDKKAAIERLEQADTGPVITSLVGGIVTAINISPGNQTDPDTPLMVIEVVDRGYSLSFPVSAERANRVSIGDQANVDRGFWGFGEELFATLTNIRPYPQNPVAERLLHFTITGDNISSGMQLNLILDQRTENFSTIVPNSAIRSDTNGDFVLVVVSRTGALGNRFIATRADVNIISSDDTHTAVSGALSSGDFVITTSNAPIEPGMQVRLVDNP